ncbi:MAG: GC-type dockerin domain-anchored protein [Phycisphaerales bacterium]
MRSNSTMKIYSQNLLKGMILASMGLAVSYASAAPQTGTASASGADRSELVALKIRGTQQQSLQILSPKSTLSYANLTDSNDPVKVVLRNKVVVRVEGITKLRALINQLPDELGSVIVEGNLAGRNDAWELTTQDVITAVRVAELLDADSSVRTAFIDSGRVTDPVAMKEWMNNRFPNLAANQNTTNLTKSTNPGVTDSTVEPAGTSDPLLANFWHLQNSGSGGFYIGNDNNVTSRIYDTLGYTGMGITVGIARPGFVQHLESEHTDFDANFDVNLTMPIDTELLPDDRVLTGIAGMISAERDNGEGGHGVAPNAQFATMSTGTDLVYAQMLDYERNNLDLKVIPVPAAEDPFTNLGFAGQFNDGAGSEFVKDFFENSLKFGRGQLGSIFVFSGGFSQSAMPFFPDPYPDGIGFDDLLIGNVVDTIDEDEGGLFSSGPAYIRSQAYFYPFASDRRTFLINSVAEDGFGDINQAIGSSVFASVYTGTSNASSFVANGAIPGFPVPRGIFSTVPGSIFEEMPDRVNDFTANFEQAQDVTQVNGSSAAITGGIIALMLEANPSLSIRDIQHIFFESIFESTRPDSVRFPEFNPFHTYIAPRAQPGQLDTWSFWQVNTALHPLPAGGVTAVRHSDQYGFGVIDAELAVEKAMTWSGTPQLILLDSGRLDDETEGDDDAAARVPVTILDAEFIEVSDTATTLRDGAARNDTNVINFCVRNNIIIESIVVELTVTGSGFNDIFTRLESPYGTFTNFSYPTTQNTAGTSFPLVFDDDESDAGFGAGVLGTDQMALIRHEFNTFKHWGELSGGRWSLRFFDFGPDDENPDGEASTDTEPAVPNVNTLGVFGLPGSNIRDEKEVIAVRFKIYGYESGEPAFLGCNPGNTSCPGDLNADGVVDAADFNLFLLWYTTGDIRADLNDNGVVDFFDISAFLAIFQPGVCTTPGTGPATPGGRPLGGQDASDSNPPTRPI